jgi:hypothetical protein
MMTEREEAARAIGFLEGFGAWVWSTVGPTLADEYADHFDRQVEILRKTLFEDKEGGDD